MSECECGCGKTATGHFLPGHDQKLRADLERRVGGLLALRAIVEAAEGHVRGESSTEGLAQAVRRIIATTRKTA